MTSPSDDFEPPWCWKDDFPGLDRSGKFLLLLFQWQGFPLVIIGLVLLAAFGLVIWKTPIHQQVTVTEMTPAVPAAAETAQAKDSIRQPPITVRPIRTRFLSGRQGIRRRPTQLIEQHDPFVAAYQYQLANTNQVAVLQGFQAPACILPAGPVAVIPFQTVTVPAFGFSQIGTGRVGVRRVGIRRIGIR